jgi:hypothetical protein
MEMGGMARGQSPNTQANVKACELVRERAAFGTLQYVIGHQMIRMFRPLHLLLALHEILPRAAPEIVTRAELPD